MNILRDNNVAFQMLSTLRQMLVPLRLCEESNWWSSYFLDAVSFGGKRTFTDTLNFRAG